MPSYKLTYFNVRGRGEVTRYMFKLKDVEFEDFRIEGNWQEFKPSKCAQTVAQTWQVRSVTCHSINSRM